MGGTFTTLSRRHIAKLLQPKPEPVHPQNVGAGEKLSFTAVEKVIRFCAMWSRRPLSGPCAATLTASNRWGGEMISEPHNFNLFSEPIKYVVMDHLWSPFDHAF